jgi:hypothetical protein
MTDTQAVQSIALGSNVTMSKSGNVVTISIDLSKSLGNSKSGKNVLIATTGGNTTLPGTGGIKLGVNCYRPV